MFKAEMDKIIIFTDNSGLFPETYIIETKIPISEIKFKTSHGNDWTIETAITNYTNVFNLIQALGAYGVKCTVLRIDELSNIYNTIHEED